MTLARRYIASKVDRYGKCALSRFKFTVLYTNIVDLIKEGVPGIAIASIFQEIAYYSQGLLSSRQIPNASIYLGQVYDVGTVLDIHSILNR